MRTLRDIRADMGPNLPAFLLVESATKMLATGHVLLIGHGERVLDQKRRQESISLMLLLLLAKYYQLAAETKTL
jgi:hypothetical protein